MKSGIHVHRLGTLDVSEVHSFATGNACLKSATQELLPAAKWSGSKIKHYTSIQWTTSYT
jgi:hypothetical protein